MAFQIVPEVVFAIVHNLTTVTYRTMSKLWNAATGLIWETPEAQNDPSPPSTTISDHQGEDLPPAAGHTVTNTCMCHTQDKEVTQTDASQAHQLAQEPGCAHGAAEATETKPETHHGTQKPRDPMREAKRRARQLHKAQDGNYLKAPKNRLKNPHPDKRQRVVQCDGTEEGLERYWQLVSLSNEMKKAKYYARKKPKVRTPNWTETSRHVLPDESASATLVPMITVTTPEGENRYLEDPNDYEPQ